MSKVPGELKYTKDHEWAKREGDLVRIGVTAHAVDQLGDVTLIDLAKVGTTVKAHGRFGDIESVKAVSELFAPISGEIVEVNAALHDSPELANTDAYGAAWMVVIKPSDPNELDALLDAAAYEALLAEEAH
jgi:glycine cleavage system H protein